MHSEELSRWQHSHEFDSGNPIGERNTWYVVVLTAVMMVIEITSGVWFRSMALLADGWHMGTHVAALAITAIAYRMARRFAGDSRFAFGTWKIEVLGGFTSGVLLGVVALFMIATSFERLLLPEVIQYEQALIVAVVGLIVNVASVLLLGEHSHGHSHEGHEHGHDHGHEMDHDLNLRAAYLHVFADATTSVLAIAALLGGKYFNWTWLDPLMGIVGAVLVAVWATGLIRDTARVLLDREMDHPVVIEIREAIESDGDSRLADLHVWRISRAQFACILVVVAAADRSADDYRNRLQIHEELVHITIELHQCADHSTAISNC